MSKQISKELTPIQRNMKDFLTVPVVRSEKQYDIVREQFKQLGRIAKELKAKKDTILKPQLEATKAVRDLFRPLEDQLEKLNDEWGLALTKYANAREIKRVTTFDPTKPSLQSVAGTRTTKVLEVLDPTLVPRDYLIVDEAKVKAALIGGADVPGCKLVDKISVTKA